MNDRVDMQLLEKIEDRRTVPNVDRMMLEAAHVFHELLESPRRVALRSEKLAPHIIVDAVNAVPLAREILDSLRADQPA